MWESVNYNINGSENGLAPNRHQTIIWTKDDLLLIWPFEISFNEISMNIQIFSFKKIHLKISFEKWRSFFLGLDMLTPRLQSIESFWSHAFCNHHMDLDNTLRTIQQQQKWLMGLWIIVKCNCIMKINTRIIVSEELNIHALKILFDNKETTMNQNYKSFRMHILVTIHPKYLTQNFLMGYITRNKCWSTKNSI